VRHKGRSEKFVCVEKMMADSWAEGNFTRRNWPRGSMLRQGVLHVGLAACLLTVWIVDLLTFAWFDP
jgi:hypothetical protein